MPSEWADRELLKTSPEADRSAPRGRRPVVWLFAAFFLAVAAVVIYVAFSNWAIGDRPAPPAAVALPAATEAARAIGGDAMSVVVPRLDESDAAVRELAARLSSHPRAAIWLANDELIRTFTVVVANIAEGKAPADLVPALRPTSRFNVIDRGTALYVDPKSYERYAGLAEAVASIDPAGAARLYATLKPRIEEAYRDLGNAEPLFDRTLERALVLLLATPVPDDPIALRPKGLGYAFGDERLETLAAAQKQLLRMGPENARTIQRSLRAVALALGIPLERLRASTR